jgi:radical SAM superfamily enzyme YgiQ (UPF0313 family)
MRYAVAVMRIVFACPPIEDFYVTHHRLAALGPELLGKKLIADGHQVTILNFPLQNQSPRARALPDELAHLKPLLMENETGRVSFFTRYHHWGPDFSECAIRIEQENPGLLCISSFAYGYAQEAITLAQAVRRRMPELFILAGGAGPSVFPEYYLDDSQIDAVLAGEGEETLPLFVKSLIRSGGKEISDPIPGLFRKRDGAVIPSSGSPETVKDFDVFPVAAGRVAGENRFSLTITRGCPKACLFCTNHFVHGRVFRVAAPAAVDRALDEAARRIDAGKCGESRNASVIFNFEDDNLLVDPQYFRQVLLRVKDKFPNAQFTAENGLDYAYLTPELVDDLVRLGFYQFNLSLVSTVAEILEAQSRAACLELFKKIVFRIARHGIDVITYFIAGFREDTPRSIAATLAFIAALPSRIGISPFYAVPGMPGFEKSVFQGLAPCLSLGSALYPWTGSLSAVSLLTAFRIARFINLLQDAATPQEKEIAARFLKEKRLFTFIKEKKEKKIIPVENCDQELVRLFFEEREKLKPW